MPSPSYNLRKHIARRASDHIALANNTTPDHLQKTPSQKKSERARQKELKRAGVKPEQAVPPMLDCHTCPEQKTGCRLTPDTCTNVTAIHRCKQCGSRCRHYVDMAVPWELCPVCEAKQ